MALFGNFKFSRPDSRNLHGREPGPTIPPVTSLSFSIITPSFNQAPYLPQTIRGVLDQNYPNLEYWIIDGGSTDGSIEIIRQYENQLAGWISEKDAGQADAIRKGFARCTGEILAWINSDDTYLPGAFDAVAEVFTRDRNLELVYGDILMTDAAGNPLVVDVLPKFNFEDLRRVCMIPQQAAFWRRSAYEAVGGIDPSFHFSMDYDLFLRLAQRGKVMHLPRLLATFRQHGAAKTSTQKAQWDKEDALLRAKYLGRGAWNTADWLRMKWLTIRQIAAIFSRWSRGEKFPTLIPARWQRLARRKMPRAQS